MARTPTPLYQSRTPPWLTHPNSGLVRQQFGPSFRREPVESPVDSSGSHSGESPARALNPCVDTRFGAFMVVTPGTVVNTVLCFSYPFFIVKLFACLVIPHRPIMPSASGVLCAFLQPQTSIFLCPLDCRWPVTRSVLLCCCERCPCVCGYSENSIQGNPSYLSPGML